MYKVQSFLFRSALVALLSLVMNLPARATDLTVFGGVQRQGKLTIQSAPSSTINLLRTINSSNFGVFGVRIGHGRVLGGEHTLAFTPNFIDADTKAILYNSNVLIQAPLPIVRPYGTAGLGLIGTSGNGAGVFGTRFAINYGGGVKFMPAGPVGMRVDVRGYTVPSAEFRVFTTENQSVNFMEVTVGVMFSLSR